ncbi:MAG: hypothetical protein MRY74_03210 [Neomegalonema sp.]|nr:hypothetical protein [Neomegalonema sp.]
MAIHHQGGRRLTVSIATALLCAAALLCGSVSASAQAIFPPLTIKDLNGRAQNFPRQLPGERTLVLVAFYREQQKALDVWIDKLGLKAADAPAWIEVPVVADYGAAWRRMVNGGMRSGITTTEARARVFTLFGGKDSFRKSLQLGSDKLVYLLVVDRKGRVLARAYGDYAPDKTAPLLAALRGES